MLDVLGVILGGGRGSRLNPLTRYRAKPAVPIGCKYRLVDVPISNCLHSGINRIFILTQFNSRSLNQHVSRTYTPHTFSTAFVDVLAAQQSLTREDWYQGTADAVRQNLDAFDQPNVRDLLILSGDQLYRMQFDEMIKSHRKREADMTVAVYPVDREAASRFGVVKLDENYRIVRFHEKPQDPRILDDMESSPAVLKRFGSTDPNRKYLASMGIYAIRKGEADKILKEIEGDDFGRDVFPNSIARRPVYGFLYNGYWEDIGTVRSFFEANLLMAAPDAPFNFYDPLKPIYTRPRFLPAARVQKAKLASCMMSDGCLVEGADLNRVMLGVRAVIRNDVLLDNVIHMGAEFYDDGDAFQGGVPLGVGSGSVIKNAIIDKDTRIGRNVELVNAEGHEEYESEVLCVRDGIIVVPRRTTLPDGFRF